VASITVYNQASTYFQGASLAIGFKFFDKEGKPIFQVGSHYGQYGQLCSIKENEKVIGIKALTVRDPDNLNHGSLYNLQFKIAKLI
jgi:hypothetical protein